MGSLKTLVRQLFCGNVAPLAEQTGHHPDGKAQTRLRGAQAADASVAAGNAALGRREYDQAIACFSAAIDVRHDDAAAYCGLGIAHFKLGQREDAADHFQMALHFAADLVEPRYYLALVAQRAGDFPAAMDYAMAVLERQPDHADACNLLGACSLALGNAGRAVELFSRAVDLRPGEASYRSNLGYVLVRDFGEVERGRMHLEKALQLDPSDAAIRCNYCSVLNQDGRTDEVIAVCSELLIRHPEMHEARLNRALALLKNELLLLKLQSLAFELLLLSG